MFFQIHDSTNYTHFTPFPRPGQVKSGVIHLDNTAFSQSLRRLRPISATSAARLKVAVAGSGTVK